MKTTLLIAALFTATLLSAQTPGFFTIDLATIQERSLDKKKEKETPHGYITITEEWRGDSLEASGIRLLNILPGSSYTVTIGKTSINEIQAPIKSVDWREFAPNQKDSTPVYPEKPDSISTAFYERLRIRMLTMRMTSDEKEVSSAFHALGAVVNEITIRDIRPNNAVDESLFESAQLLVESGMKLDFEEAFSLRKNDILIIRISRAGKTIIYTIKMPEEPQRWFVHYGFTYSPEWLSPSRQYYSKSDTGSTYLITRMNGRNGNFLDNLSPTLQFSYRLLSNRWMLSPSLVGGFSLNFTNPSAMFGTGFIIGDNLSVNIGLMFSQRYFLNGEYTDSQRIDSPKTFNDLHSKRYVPELCFSVAFRFDENPFKTEEVEDKE
jgi:hypothetical protein